MEKLDFCELRTLIPKRPADANKYSFGRLQLVAGSTKYPGAAQLCARGAFKSGCGYVSLISETPSEVLKDLPELVLGEDTKASSLVIGPGLDLDNKAEWEKFLHASIPKVIDATALHLLNKNDFATFENTIFTPHSGEAARIFSTTHEKIDSDREGFVQEVQKLLHPSSSYLLKGKNSLLVTNKEILLCPYGNVAQANAGHGDVLSGVLGSLLAQGFATIDALKLGTCTMGLCVDRLSKGKYPSGVLAHEAANFIPTLWGEK